MHDKTNTMIDSNPKDEIPPEILLRLYVDFGVDETIGYFPRDHQSIKNENQKDNNQVIDDYSHNEILNDTSKLANIPNTSKVFNIPPTPKGDNTSKGKTLESGVNNIKSLDGLRESLENIDGFSLKTTSKNIVFSDGIPSADLMIIGEAPGSKEDLTGLPFVGPSGELLDQMLISIGFDRKKNVYITNVVPWRPPGNRKPTFEEVEFCMPFLLQHIKIINPKVILLLGGLSARFLLDKEEPISKLRGKWYEVLLGANNQKIPCIVSFHPEYLLRSPHQKRLAWRDLLSLKSKLNSFKS